MDAASAAHVDTCQWSLRPPLRLVSAVDVTAVVLQDADDSQRWVETMGQSSALWGCVILALQ